MITTSYVDLLFWSLNVVEVEEAYSYVKSILRLRRGGLDDEAIAPIGDQALRCRSPASRVSTRRNGVS